MNSKGAGASGASFHNAVASGVRKMLQEAGLDPDSPQLKDTPTRVAKAWRERLQGYEQSPQEVLGRVFPSEGYDQMVVLAGIQFHSTCEHHLLPFSGQACVAYIPNRDTKHIVGLSKLARLVDVFAHRLQVQERLTQQVSQALEDSLKPVGSAVLLQAEHSCMACRGIRKPGLMTTSMLKGALRTDDAARQEFLSLALNGRKGAS